MKRLLLVCLTFLSLSCGVVMAQTIPTGKERLPYQVDRRLKQQAAKQPPTILYHGGPVMSAATNIYIVYYGRFTSTQHAILDTFLQNIGGSPAFNVNTEYDDSLNQHVQNVLNYSPAADSYNDAYSMGTSLSGSFVTTLLHNAVAGGHLPSNVNGIYVLTVSPDVKLPNSVWCAYHTHSTAIITGEDIKYALAADPPPSILASCSGNLATYHDTTSPNGDVGMDEVVDSLIHELSETVTDPDLNAWFTKGGLEVGDLCNFIYGTTFLAPNGSHANHTFGTRNYLAQEIWSMQNPVGCVLSH
jgi:Phosphate-induced protein 1 conserved region